MRQLERWSSVSTAGPQLREPDLNGHCGTSSASARYRIECKIECQKGCQVESLIECQNVCQLDCHSGDHSKKALLLNNTLWISRLTPVLAVPCS